MSFDGFPDITLRLVKSASGCYATWQIGRPEIFMPYGQHPGFATHMAVIALTQGDAGAVANALRRQVRPLDSNVPVKFTTMEQTVAASVAPPRFRTLLLGTLAGLAIVLATIGLYRVMAYMVSQRSAEIGLRMALGANHGDVLRLVMRQGLVLTGAGLLIGLLVAVTATDPITYLGGALLLAVVASVAIFIPAYRATRVDPLTALRQE